MVGLYHRRVKIAVIGGGPAGLYFSLLMKKARPDCEVTVVERNRPYDTFGWGVVFSDATMEHMREWDGVTADQIQQAFNHWDDIELEFKGEVIRSGGHGFVGIGRKKLLNILQARCEQLGVNLVFDTDVESDEDFPDADLIIASDGIFSKIRTKYETVFKPDIVVRPNRYIWLGTNKLYDAFTFLFEKTEHGWFQAHIYKFDETTTTFIVECPEHVWQAHRLDLADQAESIAFCEKVFARNLQGAKLMTNARHLRGSAWLNFQRVKCEQWSLFNGKSHVVLMGDAVHTAHFAIGSGTKLAIEDAIELTRLFVEMGDTAAHIPEVLARYQEVRNVEVLKLQNAAWNAMAWFEVCGQRYCDRFEPQQFMYSMLTRSQRISHENLRLRDAKWLEGYEAWFSGGAVMPPMLTPWKLRDLTLKNRIVVSPMAQYSAVDGVVQDYHLVHLGARAMGGAALVMVEMTSPTPEGRITPGCPGLWNDAQSAAFKRIVDFVHGQGDTRIGLQLGHSGPKGSTRVGWEGNDEPLPDGNWSQSDGQRQRDWQQFLRADAAADRNPHRLIRLRQIGAFARRQKRTVGLEKILHEKNVAGATAWVRLYDETLASLKVDVKGRGGGKNLTLTDALHLLQDKRVELRKSTAQGVAETLRNHLPTFSLVYNTLMKDKEIEDKWRHYPRPVSSRNLSNQVEDEVVDALVAAVKAAYPRTSHRYYKLKAKWLGQDQLDHWDRNAPLPHASDRSIPWNKAQDVVLKSYAAFSPALADIGKRSLCAQ